MLKRFLYPILLGTAFGIVISLLVLLALSVAAASFDIAPVAVVPLAIVANALGAVACGFTAAKLGRRNGWLLGSISSLVLFLLTTASGFGLYQTVDGSFLLIKALIMLACGMTSGIIAVNSQKKRAHR